MIPVTRLFQLFTLFDSRLRSLFTLRSLIHTVYTCWALFALFTFVRCSFTFHCLPLRCTRYAFTLRWVRFTLILQVVAYVYRCYVYAHLLRLTVCLFTFYDLPLRLPAGRSLRYLPRLFVLLLLRTLPFVRSTLLRLFALFTSRCVGLPRVAFCLYARCRLLRCYVRRLHALLISPCLLPHVPCLLVWFTCCV